MDRKIMGAVGFIVVTLTFPATAQQPPQKSIAETARESREARFRKAAEETVAKMCSQADDPKVQQAYPKIQEKCKDQPALVQTVFELALKKAKQMTGENVKRMQDALAETTSAASAAPSTPQGAVSESNDVESLQAMNDSLSDKTPRELGEQFARDIQFPGRPAWEQQLSAARDKLVARTGVVISLIRSRAPSGALNNALYDMRLAQVQYSDVQAEGISKAADWEKRAGK